MKALYYDGKLEIKEIEKPTPPPGEALVKVTLAGICATDREIAAGYMNFRGVPGHEFVGIVEQSGDPDLLGKRVVGEINCACGDCEMCRKCLERHCPHRTVLGIQGRNGALAEYLLLPNRNLKVVSAILDDRQAVFSEPLAAALEISEQIKLEPGARTLIIGDGKLACLIAQALRLQGLELAVSGKNAEKLGLIQSWGIPVLEDDPHPAFYDLVIEASGSPSGWTTAVTSVKPRGTIVLKSTYQGSLEFNPAPLVVNEITLVGSRCGRLEPALRLLEAGLIDVDSLIDVVYQFDDVLDAFEYASRPEAMKVLVEF